MIAIAAYVCILSTVLFLETRLDTVKSVLIHTHSSEIEQLLNEGSGVGRQAGKSG